MFLTGRYGYYSRPVCKRERLSDGEKTGWAVNELVNGKNGFLHEWLSESLGNGLISPTFICMHP
jgi:hypothetical protein